MPEARQQGSRDSEETRDRRGGGGSGVAIAPVAAAVLAGDVGRKRFVGERWWLTTWALYLPQPLFRRSLALAR